MACPIVENSNSGTISKFDLSLFLWYNKNHQLVGYILVHIDGFLFTGNKDHNYQITTFLTEKEEKLNFRYLRVHITSTNNTITLDQHQYFQNPYKSKERANKSLE